MFKRLQGKVFKETQEVNNFVTLFAFEGSNRVSAVTKHHGGVSVCGQGIEFGVPPHRAIEVGMGVNDPGGNETIRRIDDRFASRCEVLPYFGDDAVLDSNISSKGRCACAVDDCAACDQ